MRSQSELGDGRTFCEFFAGIGLVREGLEPSGWRCVYANDHDPKKQEQYEARFGADHFHLGDVFDTESIVERTPSSVTLATASFPCVDLSLAGHWRGIEGTHSSAVFGFLECLEGLGHPPLLLLENVVGLLSSKGGEDFARLTQLLADSGYWLDAFKLDAKYFVPQSRPRIFIVGVHKSAISACKCPTSDAEFSLGENGWEAAMRSCPELRPKRLVDLMIDTKLATGWFCSELSEPVTVRDELSSFIDVDEDQEWWDDGQVTKHYEMMSDSHREEVNRMMGSGETFVGTIYRRKRHGKTRAETRFDGIAGCLRTPKGGSARQIVIVVAEGELRLRWMSPREYARLQGASDFPLVGRTNQQLFGFGDAVCVPAIKWIDEQILTPLESRLNAVLA